jgi:hypothetical protein
MEFEEHLSKLPKPEADQLERRKTRLELESNHSQANLALYRKTHTKASAWDICAALTRIRGYYLSHHSAMYLLGLHNQKPKDFILSKEFPSKPRPEGKDIDEFKIHRAFLKPNRYTSKFFTHKKNKFYLLEKVAYREIGITSKSINVSSSSPLTLRFTDLERTFIDSIISPQYAGGILNVISSFEGQRFNVDLLYNYYESINPAYPFWQNIGLILSSYHSDYSQEWESLFERREKVPFYLDRPISRGWDKSEKWQVSYPPGLVNEN